MSRHFPSTLIPPLHAKLFLTNLATLLLLLSVFSAAAMAGQVSLAWDPNTESNLAGYNLYYKVGSPGAPYEGSGLEQGDSHIAIPLENLSDRNNPNFTLSGLPAGETFYLVITAYNSDGNESLFSNEISCQTAVATETFTISALPQVGGTISPSGNTVFDVGSSQTYTAVAADNYHLVDLLVDEISVGALDIYTFTSLDSNHTITAIFALDTHTITASAGSNGVINPSGSIPVEHGAEQIFTFTPAEHHHIENVTVNNQIVGALTSYQFTNLAADATVSVSFTINTYTIEAGASNGGTISPSGNTTFTAGADQVYTVASADNYHLVDLLVDEISVGALDIYTFTSLDSNHTITAIFALDTHTITASAGSNGVINPSGSIPVEHGTEQIFTFTPAEHYHIEDITVNNQTVGALTSYQFTDLAADATISAIFAIDTYTVEAWAGDTGSIYPAGSIVADYNETLYFEIIPDDGMQIKDVLVDGGSIGPVSEYYFTELNTAHTIEATFEPLPGDPLANAGPDQNVAEATETILDGTNSIDLNDEIVSYHWEQISGTPVEITTSDNVKAGFVTPIPGSAGEALEFCLTVTNSAGNQTSDYCIVNVILDNLPPEAEAGFEQTVAEGVLVQLNGADSFDPDDGIGHYQWIQVAGNQVELSNYTAATPIFMAPEIDSPEGTSLIFLLTVTDFGGLKACDRCIVNISWSNEPPIADAGYDQVVSGGGTVHLDGFGSYDNDDGISAYHWTQSQGIPVTLSDPMAMQPDFTAPEAGSAEALLSFRLTISDNNGLHSQAECRVEIIPDVTDTIAPYLTILSPDGAYSTKSNSVSASGEAADNVKVEVVTWSNDQGGAGTASGTEQWSIGRIRLRKGYNTITITATDTAGNSTDNEIVVYRR